MDEDFAWQFKLQGAPTEVFESLIRAADSEGRLFDVSRLEAALTYASTDIDEDQCGWIRATVRRCPEGSMVTIIPTRHTAADKGDVAAQAASVASLVGQLRRYYPHEIVVAVP